MRLSILSLGFLASLCLAHPLAPNARDASESNILTPDIYEAIKQAAYKTAHIIDTKNYAALSEVMTQDVIYNSTSLGPGYGGLSIGREQVITNLKAAFGDSLIEHIVANSLIQLESATEAHVIYYLIWSKWDPTALNDVKKTFRIYEECTDIWVLSDGAWKMKYSVVTNMGPKVEMPYFGPDASDGK